MERIKDAIYGVLKIECLSPRPPSPPSPPPHSPLRHLSQSPHLLPQHGAFSGLCLERGRCFTFACLFSTQPYNPITYKSVYSGCLGNTTRCYAIVYKQKNRRREIFRPRDDQTANAVIVMFVLYTYTNAFGGFHAVVDFNELGKFQYHY